MLWEVITAPLMSPSGRDTTIGHWQWLGARRLETSRTHANICIMSSVSCPQYLVMPQSTVLT